MSAPTVGGGGWLGLSGKRAIVTGAASGLGRAISCCFAEQGVSVAMLDVKPEDQGWSVAEVRTRAEAAARARCACARACAVRLCARVETAAGKGSLCRRTLSRQHARERAQSAFV